MKTHPPRFLSVVLATVFTMSFLPTKTQAQGFNFYGQNPFSFMGFGQAQGNDDLGKNVYKIDSLADQMAWRFGWEIRSRGDCRDSAALLQLMKNQAGLTNNLIKAYKGNSGQVFTKASHDVRDNLTRIQTLRKKVQVSDSVNALITKSVSLANYITRNAHLFRPEPVGKPQAPLPPRGNTGHDQKHDNGSHKRDGQTQNTGFSNSGIGYTIYRG